MNLTTPVLEDSQETMVGLERRINQLEETLLEVYPTFCHVYGEIDFAQVTPESFNAPYSTLALPIPHTKLNVTLMTTPPGLVIGMPPSHTPGPLQWGQILEIQFPGETKFMSFRYGGGTGTVEWFSDAGAGYTLPSLLALSDVIHTRRFHLARHEGIRRIKITSNGEMFLCNLAIGIS